MSGKRLKDDLRGFWLPLDLKRTKRREFYIFLRKEFTLDSMISFADLWISADPGYHLYINGCHVGYNHGMTSGENHLLDHYDAAQFLDIGVNTIAIEIHVPVSKTCFTAAGKPGVYCQLDLNSAPFLWTSDAWKICKVDCSRKNPPVCHVGLGSTLQEDLALIPDNWLMGGFDDSLWQHPEQKRSVKEKPEMRFIFGDQEFVWEENEFIKPVLGGIVSDEIPYTCVSYAHLEEFSGGTYAAGTFVYAEEEFDTDIIVSSDDPCVIYGNDMEIYRSCQNAATPPLIEKSDSFKAGESLLQTAAFRLKKGWNKLLVVQQTASNSMGFLLLFPGQTKEKLLFRTKAEPDAGEGWCLAGPLELPLEFAMPSIDLSAGKNQYVFHNMADLINDASTLLHSCTFYPYSFFRSSSLFLDNSDREEIPFADGENTLVEKNILRQGEYAIYDLGQLMYGFPRFEFEGSKGDIVDITPGIHFAENRIRSVGPMGRKTDTVILSGGGMEKDIWHRFYPMGARYIMVTVRKAKKSVALQGSFHYCNTDRSTDIDFHCSDPVLQEVWEKAIAASEQCVKNSIIDNPLGRCCQSLPESYIYARTLYTFFGVTSPVENALKQFAYAQLANGMIPSVAPSGIHSFAPDSALCWILWLREHWMAEGNVESLKSLLPVLERLLDLFAVSSSKNNGLLSVEIFGKTEFLNDSGNMEEEGISTALNALYCRALLRSEQLFLAGGEEEKAQECHRKADFIASALQSMAFDEEKGLFADHTLHRVRSENCSLETNILALYGGLVPRYAQRDILENILFAVKEDPGRFINSRLLGFLLDTLCACDLQKEAMQIVRDFVEYYRMYENIPTYENLLIFPLTVGNGLIREVLGLRPASPGGKQFYFNPACNYVQQAKGKVTNGSEQLFMEWSYDEKQELSVKIDSNFPLEIVPLIPEEVKDCTFHLGQQVHLLQPEEKAGE